ncbi:cytochrome P450 3A6-like [Centruroides vittatus]|uniref:cytochrome P450 3A6-like n=1 Tax=Centruroides vittatus TaxID=120091 RepID=UPI00350F97B1
MKKYGSIYGYYFGVNPVLAVNDPELLKLIQVKEAQIFHKRNPYIPMSAVPNKLFGISNTINDGPIWKQSRDMITPSYTTSKLKMLTPTVNRTIEENWKEVREMIKNGETLEMREIYSILLADMAFQTTLGVRVNNKQKMARSLDYAFETGASNTINFISACFPEFGDFLYFIRTTTHKVKRFINVPSMLAVVDLCKDAISARLSLQKQENYADVLQQMINTIYIKNQAKAEKISKDSEPDTYKKSLLTPIHCLANSFYVAIATYDTIRNPMMFATYLIAKYPEVQDRIREEIFQFSNKDESIDYISLTKMKYLDQVFCETLRLYPPVPTFINRIAEEDYKYKDILIPKGMTVYVPQWGLHRNPEYWSEPDEFKPERFDDKSKVDPYIYQPFGIGPRHCTGMRPAQLIGRLILANLVKNFKITLCPETKEIETDISLVIIHSKNPVYIKATPI